MRLRTIRRVALWLLAGFVILILLLFAAVHTPPARRYALGIVQGLVSDLRVESLSYNLAAGTATLVGIELGSESEPFLTADRAEIAVSLRSLLRRSINIERATISNLAVSIVVDENGNTNIPEFGEDDGQPPENRLPDFLVRQANANGSLSFRSPDANVQVPAWTLGITGSAGPSHTLTFAIGQPGSAQYTLNGESRTSEISTLQLNGGFTRDQVTIEQLRTVITGADLTASGTMRGFADRDLNVEMNATADLVPLLGSLATQQNLSGTVVTRVAATGKIGELQVSAGISGSNLTADRLSQVNVTANADWDQMTNVVQVQAARVVTPEGAITADATYTVGDESARNRANARIERLDLARVSRLADLPVQIASTLTGSVDAQWQGNNFEAADANAALRLTAAGVTPTREIVPISGSVDARVRNKQVNATLRQATAYGVVTNAEIATHLDRRNLTGTLHAEVPDAGRTLAALEVQMTTPATGQATLDANLGGTWDRPTAMATLTGTNIDYGEVRGLSLNARANYTPELLEVPEAVVAWSGSQITAQATVGLEGETKPLAFTASSTEIPISNLLSLANRTEPVTGFVSFNAQGTGTVDAPQVTANLMGRDLVAYEEPLGELAARVNYTDPIVDIPELRLTRPMELGTLNGTARYDLTSRAYNVDLKGDKIVVNRPEGSAVIDAAISGMGTIDDPAADIKVTASNVVAQGRMLGEVNLTGAVANRTANVNLTAPAFNIRAEAQASTDAPYNTTARVFLENTDLEVGSSRVDLQACKLEYSIVSPK